MNRFRIWQNETFSSELEPVQNEQHFSILVRVTKVCFVFEGTFLNYNLSLSWQTRCLGTFPFVPHHIRNVYKDTPTENLTWLQITDKPPYAFCLAGEVEIKKGPRWLSEFRAALQLW